VKECVTEKRSTHKGIYSHIRLTHQKVCFFWRRNESKLRWYHDSASSPQACLTVLKKDGFWVFDDND